MRKAAFVVISIVLLSLLHIPEASSRDEVIFENLSLQEGLSQTTVRAILMDSRGYMWFGTEGGLNRYDGYQFKTYRRRWGRDDGISDNFVTSIVEDHRGDLWIGTMSGLNRLDHETESFERFVSSSESSNSLIDDRITALKSAKDGSLWIGTRGGLEMMDISSRSITHYG
ncbi:MAG: hypothetical protein EOM02_09150, partial [Synergistales bacterium]|nr:hypothetical protein [Synergistales bacterium]